MTTPNSCPFCGYSNIKTSSKHKWDWDINQRVEKYTHYCLCNKCHAKGPVTTITIPYPSSSKIKQIEEKQKEIEKRHKEMMKKLEKRGCV